MTREIRIGMSAFQVRVHSDGDSMFIAIWSQRDEVRETRACSSQLGALDEAKRMARAIDVCPVCDPDDPRPCPNESGPPAFSVPGARS